MARKRTRHPACGICFRRTERHNYCEPCGELLRLLAEVHGRDRGHGPGASLDRVSEAEDAARREELHRRRVSLCRYVGVQLRASR